MRGKSNSKLTSASAFWIIFLAMQAEVLQEKNIQRRPKLRKSGSRKAGSPDIIKIQSFWLSYIYMFLYKTCSSLAIYQNNTFYYCEYTL